MTKHAIEKTLSANDTGQTGGHQAGMLIPKSGGVLGFFPSLDETLKNPRTVIDVIDDTRREWTFSFIYYNNRLFGGTRNEFRLTGMTAFIREFNLKSGDRITLTRGSDRVVRIGFERANKQKSILKLGSGWKVIAADF
jgi:hypothetical protein